MKYQRMRIGFGIVVTTLMFVGVSCDQTNTTNRKSSGTGEQTLGDSEWAVVLDMFTGPGHGQQAGRQVRTLASQSGMTDFWAANEGQRSIVYYGRYPSPRTEEAQRDLARLRELHQNGRLQSATVNLLPIREEVTDDLHPWDLRSVRNPSAIYTLQVGYYDEQYGSEYRKAAEEAVAVYRADGDEAYYYHGPNRSLVLIGAFGSNATSITDERGQRGEIVYHPHIRELQKKHPYNLGNGVTLLMRDRAGGQQITQPSFLVRIPR